MPPEAAEPLEGSRLDECIGVGHQVFYGSQTWQQKAEDAAFSAADGDVDGAAASAQDAATQVGSFPAAEALFFVGYKHCVFSKEEGIDLAWLNPVAIAGDQAIHWSGHDDDLVGNLDDDGDREIGIVSGSGNHNLWQSWASPHQAFTADFQALEFDVEDGEIHESAKVIVSLSATPLEVQSPWAPVWFDCQITFSGSALIGHTDASGQVSMSPTDATFQSRSEDCDDAAAAWNAATTDQERRDVLGHLRVVQLSFWGFERSPEAPGCGCAIQLDNVALLHPASAAESAATGHVKAKPAPSVTG